MTTNNQVYERDFDMLTRKLSCMMIHYSTIDMPVQAHFLSTTIDFIMALRYPAHPIHWCMSTVAALQQCRAINPCTEFQESVDDIINEVYNHFKYLLN